MQKRKRSPGDSDGSGKSPERTEAPVAGEETVEDDCHVNDIGQWINCSMNSTQKRELLTSCWVPPSSYNFAADATHLKRKFNFNWLGFYEPWLVYSRKLKGAFCLHCVLFKPPVVRGVVSYFVLRPFTKFKNIHDYCNSHASSNVHKEATLSAKLFLEQNPVDMQMQSGHEKQVIENKQFLKSIISSIIFCGTHDLPLRGKSNHEGIVCFALKN